VQPPPDETQAVNAIISLLSALHAN
jgi:hypothetical protein